MILGLTWKVPFRPLYTITPTTARSLMQIEAAKELIGSHPLSLAALANLRQKARVRSSHFSTRIEGNRLTLEEADRAIRGVEVRGRSRDVAEVRNYWAALQKVQEWANAKRSSAPSRLIPDWERI